MPYYAKIETTTYGVMTAGCGDAKLADRLANTNTQVAGSDFSFIYHFKLNIQQQHNQAGAANASSAPFCQDIELVLPDYEPLPASMLIVMNGHDVIQKLTLNLTARRAGQESLLGQYVMTNGILIGAEHVIQDQRDPEALKHRGEVRLALRFNQIQFQNRVTNTQGQLTTTAS
jgi:hypothetical protein